ncbi:MAG: AMP-binding protein, partial [Actinobacteria bacterium]|nr:AMP-binding protein [Actinomycetota bacterium]
GIMSEELANKNYKCWPQGVFKHLSYPEVPVFEFKRSSAREWPERNALIFGGMEMTYREIDQLSDRFATAHADRGVKKGDRVGLHLPNCAQFAIAYFGLLKAGAIFVPLSPLLADRELSFELNDAGVETFVGLDLLFAVPQQVIPDTPVKRTILVSLADCYPPIAAPVKTLQKQPVPEGTLDFTDLIAKYPPEPPEIEFDPREDIAHIAYTGGTTGTPKGVMVTHYNAVVNSCQFAYWLGGGDATYEDGIIGSKRMEGDKEEDHVTGRGVELLLVVVPWFHAMGVIGYLDLQVLTGTTMVVYPRFDPGEYLLGINKFRPTAFGGAPQLFIPLVEHPLFEQTDMSDIKLVVSGAAPIPQYLLETMLEKLPGVVCEAYGLSECTMGCSCNPTSREGFKIGSVGLPLADTEIKIMDAETGETELPIGEAGEVVLRGPQVMKGYWNKPEETDNVLKDGWLYTGDIGKFDEDGYLFIVDRKKDMLIYKGYNVYPRDLEEVINEHPAVAQSAVVGKKDDRYGDLPVAFVELVEGSQVKEEEILEYANEH